MFRFDVNYRHKISKTLQLLNKIWNKISFQTEKSDKTCTTDPNRDDKSLKNVSFVQHVHTSLGIISHKKSGLHGILDTKSQMQERIMIHQECQENIYCQELEN